MFESGAATELGVADIHVAFNYGQSTGSAQLLRFITEHTEVGSLSEAPKSDADDAL